MSYITGQSLVPRLGVVLNIQDPLNLGRLKVYVPSLWETTNVNILPWVNSGRLLSPNSFFGVLPGDTVKITPSPTNDMSFTWDNEQNPFSRKNFTYDGGANIFFNSYDTTGAQNTFLKTDQDGSLIKTANSLFNIKPEGEINLTNPLGCGLNINSTSSVTIGKPEETEEPGVLGNKLVDLLKALKDDLNLIATECSNNPYTTHLTDTIKTAATNLDSNIAKILSKTVKITV